MKNKKGLSDVISTVLIVLLALAAIAIVWGFLQPVIIGGGNKLNAQTTCLNIDVKPTFCDATNFEVTVQYVSGEGLVSIGAVIIDGANREAQLADDTPTILNTEIVEGFANFSTSAKAVAYAVVSDSEGNPITCEPRSAEINCVA